MGCFAENITVSTTEWLESLPEAQQYVVEIHLEHKMLAVWPKEANILLTIVDQPSILYPSFGDYWKKLRYEHTQRPAA